MKFVKDTIKLFTSILTGTVISAAVYIQFFFPGTQMDTSKKLWQIIIVSAISSLCMIFCYTKKEPGKFELIIRNLAVYIYVNVVVISCAFHFNWLSGHTYKNILFLVIEIAIVFFVLEVTMYYHDKRMADSLNEKLEEYKNRNDE